MFTLNLKGACPMSPLVYRMNAVLSRVVHRVPVGTNLGLFHCLWMLLSGRLLLSRGAVIPGLAALGLAAEAVRRAWAALAYGQWHAAQLLEAWEQLVREEQAFHAHQYGGYRPVACDLVGFFRPRLQDGPTKHYSSAAGKALPAIPLGTASRAPTRGALLPRHPRTAMKPGSSVLGPPPCRCTRHFGMIWSVSMPNRARPPSAPSSSMIRDLTSRSS